MALYTRPSSGSITTQYLHLDHLGSIAEVTNASGAVDVSENFDAFGQRRDATDWSGAPASGVLTTIAGVSQRGYTLHTNLESSSLIHMNGRIADGLTGRFLSADPYVTGPGMTQSFNRYAYVNNNPLTYTDPSGFVPCVTPADIQVCASIIGSVVSFIKDLFGSKNGPPPPPKGCWQNPNACWGKGGSSKLFDVVTDILKTPGSGMLGDWQSVWGYGQFGSAGCGQYCLNWGRQVYPGWETIHEGALIIMPGYDLGTCISSRGDCSLLDWGLGVLGTIPGEKVVALGVKATFAAAIARQANRAAGRVGEEFLANTYGGAQQVFRRTSTGGRYIDNLADGIAMESKVGRTALTSKVRNQIAKDIELMSTPGSGVTDVQWHFFRGQSGLGPTDPLRKALEEAGIDIVVH